jgi:uncharacterized protein (TIGR03663 family)
MKSYEKPLFFDRSLPDLLKPTWEKAIFVVILLVAVVSRFWDLGARAMSHDESLHALYSYYLYDGTGYQHNPMMHGPFLFHANALIYFLFGDNDFTARIVPALFGVFLVMSPLLLRRWLGRVGAVITSILLLVSPITLYYSRYIRNDVYIAVWTVLMIAALFHFLQERRPGWFYAGAAVLMLSMATKEVAYIFGFIGLVFVVELFLWEKASPRRQVWLYVAGGVLGVILLVVAALLKPTPVEGAEAAEAAGGVTRVLQSVVMILGGTSLTVLISATLIHSRYPEPGIVQEAVGSLSWRNWLVAILVMILIYILLFTTFFTNPVGLGSGIFGSISYWLAQQEVQRGGQPWYYYFLLLPMYEFVPLLFGLLGMVYYLFRDLFSHPEREEAEAVSPSELPLAGNGGDARFVVFLIFWTLSTLFIYSWAGEKMPWLGVEVALPLIILSGKFAGDLFGRVDWRAVWRQGGALLALLLPITLFGLYTLIRLQPFRGLSIFKLQETGSWLAALVVTVLLLVLVWMVIRRLRGRYTVLVVLATLLTFLSFFTVRFAWMASYINYDYATELLVYAHGGADVKPTMDEIADISRRTVGDKMIEVAYDSDVSWPLEWYMREYPNRKFYGDTPTRESLDVPVVLAGDKVEAKVRSFLGERYDCFKRRLVWWPNQQYMGLTWQRVVDILTSPEKRQILWNILYRREYPRTPDDWYHVHNFSFCVRKDVAQQLWNYGAVPPEAYELPSDPYAEAHVDLPSARVWGEVGTGPGQFNHPRGVAVGPDGNVYVVDSDNHRVQVFDAEGTFLHQWGSNCNLATGLGCLDPDDSGPLETGDGQFQEPWGIAVGADGRVYVADTWNHRIQVFDADGTFLTKWGTYGQTEDASWLFYGPRDVAVDAAGQVFVTDTGNKRVMVFDPNGTYLAQWGRGGAEPGQFEEPVGIAVDATGMVYVADTWNQRVQVFDSQGTFLRQWTVEAWYGESVVNKPYLALDGQGRVYVTDPEGYRVAVFSGAGDLLATFGLYGYDDRSFSLPTGINLDAAGFVYVADTDGQRVMKFEPLP